MSLHPPNSVVIERGSARRRSRLCWEEPAPHPNSLHRQLPLPPLLLPSPSTPTSLSQTRFWEPKWFWHGPRCCEGVTTSHNERLVPVSAVLASVSVGFCCSWDERRS